MSRCCWCSGKTGLKIADIGCGTGASTLVLAKALDASVTAVDFLPDFLHDLDIAAERQNLGKMITTLSTSMDALPFEEQSLDAIWSEGVIYNIGFANGIKAWRRFLKPDGILAVSELTWLTQARPAELEQHWNREYPEVNTASAKMAILEGNGFSPLDTSRFRYDAGWTTTIVRRRPASQHSWDATTTRTRQRPSWQPKNTRLLSTSDTRRSSVMAITWREGLLTEPLKGIDDRVHDLGIFVGALLAFSSSGY